MHGSAKWDFFGERRTECVEPGLSTVPMRMTRLRISRITGRSWDCEWAGVCLHLRQCVGSEKLVVLASFKFNVQICVGGKSVGLMGKRQGYQGKELPDLRIFDLLTWYAFWEGTIHIRISCLATVVAKVGVRRERWG